MRRESVEITVDWIEGSTWGVGVADTAGPADCGSEGVVSSDTDSKGAEVVRGVTANAEDEVAGDTSNKEVSDETHKYQHSITSTRVLALQMLVT